MREIFTYIAMAFGIYTCWFNCFYVPIGIENIYLTSLALMSFKIVEG